MSVDEVDRADALYRRKRRDAYLANSAGASFFLATAIIFTLRNRTVKEYDIEQEAWRWQTGAALCREALSSPHRATVDPALAAALSMSADYFDGHATSIGTGATASYYVIKRNSRLRAPGEDENIRGQVREVAAVTKKIFGRALYGTVATAASVATDLKISGNNAEKWCADLPAPLRNELSRRDIPQHRRSP
jgi:hypothetical protein